MREKKVSRRSFLKRMIGSILGMLGLGGGTYYYAKYVEPSMVTIHKETISSTKLAPSFNGVKILQFSDTHLGFHYNLDQFQDLIEKIQQQQPDLLLFTGDLVDAPHLISNQTLDQTIQLLKTLKAPLGKYWIYGNHDHGGYGTEKIAQVMKASGFHLLKNEHTVIQKNNHRFTLAGLDDVMLGKPNVKLALHETDPKLFTMLMCHEPDYALTVQQYPIDVQVSGHSHGGQVQIPFIGYLITPPLAEKYVEGKHRLGSYPLTIYISRGIGTTRLPYRFLCQPEFTIYTLQSTPSP